MKKPANFLNAILLSEQKSVKIHAWGLSNLLALLINLSFFYIGWYLKVQFSLLWILELHFEVQEKFLLAEMPEGGWQGSPPLPQVLPVNPISTRGADYAHFITAGPPRFLDSVPPLTGICYIKELRLSSVSGMLNSL